MKQKDTNQQKFLLPLNLQFFAEDPTDPANPIDTQDTTQTQTDPNPTGGDPVDTPEVKFTQEDIERIVKDRLAREKKKREEALEQERAEAERKRLEDEQKYKELYETLQRDLEAQRATALQAKKESLLIKAGYSDEQASTMSRLLEGEEDDDLKASLEKVKTLFPPVTTKPYGDPNPGNGGHQTPKKKNLSDVGREQFERLVSKGKIKGRK